MATSSDTSDQNNVKSRRPAESAFKQQRLPAWQPILTAGTVLPTFFVIGIAFIPVGIGLLYFSDEVKEYVQDYTYCESKVSNITCADYIKQKSMSPDDKCYCELTFNLTEDFKADVYFYYGLSNYYQNHRRYVKSRDDNQLLGRLGQDPSSDCDPFAWGMEDGVKKPIAPCGAIANSLFNDTLSLFSVDLNKDVPVNRTGIAWDSDKNIKFRNPEGDLEQAFANYTKPSNWPNPVWKLDLENPSNNGFQNEDLIVWMRTAALPTFRKLYRRVDHEQEGFRKGLSKGTYRLTIQYNYPVTDFDGHKSFVISTTSLLGGKNPFLGVAYVVVGTLCLLLGIVLLIIHVRCSKRYYPTPTESLIFDIDAMTKPGDRRLENLRAINLAYSASKTEPTPDDSTDDTKPNINQTETSTTPIVPDSNLKPKEPDSNVKPKEPDSNSKSKEPDLAPATPHPTKHLIRDTAKYTPEEKLKLETAAVELQDTEAGWADYTHAYEKVYDTQNTTITESPNAKLKDKSAQMTSEEKLERERERLWNELMKYKPNKDETHKDESKNNVEKYVDVEPYEPPWSENQSKKDELKNVEPNKDESKKVDPKKVVTHEHKNVEPIKDESKKDDPHKVVPNKKKNVEPNKDESKKDDPQKGVPNELKDVEPNKGESNKDDPHKDKTAKTKKEKKDLPHNPKKH